MVAGGDVVVMYSDDDGGGGSDDGDGGDGNYRLANYGDSIRRFTIFGNRGVEKILNRTHFSHSKGLKKKKLISVPDLFTGRLPRLLKMFTTAASTRPHEKGRENAKWNSSPVLQ